MAQKNKKKKLRKFQNKPKRNSRENRDESIEADRDDSADESSGSGFEEVEAAATGVGKRDSNVSKVYRCMFIKVGPPVCNRRVRPVDNGRSRSAL